MKTLDEEVAEVASLPHELNQFSSPRNWFGNYPILKAWIQEELYRSGRRLATRDTKEREIPPESFELQTHTISVHEHTDSVRDFEFGIYVLKCLPVVRTAYESRTQFTFYRERHKSIRFLNEGDCITFNPRKPHSMTYFGDAATFMLFSVDKL